MNIEKLVIRVKRYTIPSSKLARMIYYVQEQLKTGQQITVGITNDFDSLVMIVQPYKNANVKTQYIIEETNQKQFENILINLQALSSPTSTQFIYKGVTNYEYQH